MSGYPPELKGASKLGTLLALGAGALGAFLTLPFAVVALSQVTLMVGRESDLASGAKGGRPVAAQPEDA